MISGIIYDKNGKERKLMSHFVKDGIAMRVDDDSKVQECETSSEFTDAIGSQDKNDFCCLEFTGEQGREMSTAFRGSFPDSPLLLMVDVSVSPREYVRPDIMPSAIILRPTDSDQMKQAVDEFLDSVLVSEDEDQEGSLTIETKEGITRVDIDLISYVEASAKKVFIRTKKEEYGYYDTLDNLESVLPDNFIRCHRGFIVNLSKVSRFVAGESALYLNDGTMIPVSRSYKGTVREALQ